MAVYFLLYRKGSAEASSFQDVDAAICQNLELPFDEDKFVSSWYDTIGLRLALGHSFAAIVDEFHDYIVMLGDGSHDFYRTIIRICHFLNENYSVNSWHGR